MGALDGYKILDFTTLLPGPYATMTLADMGAEVLKVSGRDKYDLVVNWPPVVPGAQVTGIDRWGKEYASFNKPLCEENARAEGVENISFMKGDATHLEFPNETFDAVASNYVYHNIPSRDRQAILLETLRTLKKGGTFAIHDIFSAGKYGDMQSFMKKLEEMGYEKVELIDTANGKWMSKGEAGWMGLSGSALLTGKK